MSAENPAVPLSSIADGDDLFDALTGPQSASGARVSRNRVLGLAAVWRGVNLIAGDVGRHAFRVYAYAPGGGLIDAPGHQAARVMRRPNAFMTPFTFRQTLQAHALLSGNGYAYILRDPDARPLELLPLDPDNTWPVRVNGELWYVTRAGEPIPGKRRGAGQLVKLKATDVLHIKGLGFDGLVGYPVIKILRDTFGGAIASRDYGSRYFKNNASPGVVLEVPVGMKDTAIAVLRKSWSDLHQGFDRAHLPAILRDGVKLVPYTANARDAQLLENRTFDSREVANILGVPPHKLGDPSRTAYNSLESENQGYHEDTLGRWFCGWEQEADAKLLTELEKDAETHCCRFDVRPLSRVGVATRAAYYSTAIQNGWLNVDEVRAEEGRNPLPKKAGQVYRSPVNLAPSTPVPADGGDAPDPNADPNTEPAADTGATDTPPAAGLDLNTAGADVVAADAAGGGVQDTALNGAQITSLLLVTDAVSTKRYDAPSAEAIIQAAFPLMSRDLIHKFIAGLSAYQPPAAPAADPPAAPVTTPDLTQTTGDQ